jgi:excisionase family DNA binding protein
MEHGPVGRLTGLVVQQRIDPRRRRRSRDPGLLSCKGAVQPSRFSFGFFEYAYADVMPSALRERTVLPPENPADLNRLAQGLVDAKAAGGAKLVGPDGSQIDIPEDLYSVLRDVVNALSQGLAISIAPHNTMLTTQEAADLLNISRPTLVRLLTDGEIPHTMRGRHRRVLLRDILDYTDRTRTERRSALDQMATDAEDDGLYEATIEARPSR